MIDVNAAWVLFLSNARKFYESGEIYVSPKEERPYRIVDVIDNGMKITDNSIRVLRVVKGTELPISFELFKGLVERLNAHAGILPMEAIRDSHSVLTKTSFVTLLNPLIDWDEEREHIVETGLPVPAISRIDAGDPRHDDPNYKAWREVRVRNGQNALRDTLFYLYEHQCCVTMCKVPQVLQAAHIEPHFNNGNNSSTNALLLRSDIHVLFDASLLGIHPQTNTIHISRKLQQTEYEQLHGKALQPRKDGVPLNKEALMMRWQMFQDAEKLSVETNGEFIGTNLN